MFIQQSEEFLRQIDTEMERLQQLRDQVQATIHSDEALEEPAVETPRKRALKGSPGKKVTAKKVVAKRGRPKANATVEA